MNNVGKMVYRKRSRVVSFLLQLENKQQIMPNNVDTQKKHMYTCIRDIVVHVVCHIVFPSCMSCFTCIVTLQLIVKIRMIGFYRGGWGHQL